MDPKRKKKENTGAAFERQVDSLFMEEPQEEREQKKEQEEEEQ